MALVQLDLFDWTREAEREVVIPLNGDITVESLADALIKYFGHWVATKQRLLGDDWTICETLTGIHKVFSREQLKAVSNHMWNSAWKRFETRYLTKRVRSDFYWPWPGH